MTTKTPEGTTPKKKRKPFRRIPVRKTAPKIPPAKVMTKAGHERTVETKARKTLTPEVITEICNKIKLGNTPKGAAVASGCSEPGFYGWTKRGRDELEAYAKAEADGTPPPELTLCSELVEKIWEAEAFAEQVHIQNIAKAGRDGQWRASAWWLERRNKAYRIAVEHRAVDGEGKDAPPHPGVLVVPGLLDREAWNRKFGSGADASEHADADQG